MAETDSQAWILIAGLGNPGREYQHNRHNVGFHCLGLLAAKYGLSFGKKQSQADLALGHVAGQKAILLKPLTFVNLSGEAVGAVAHFYKVAPGNILVIYDDLDLPQGTLRLRPGGGSGGHNGIKSIARHLNTQEFPRLRVGIGRPPGRMEPKDYVLQDFSEQERAVMEQAYARVVEGVETFIRQGIKEAMNRFNASPKPSTDPTEQCNA